MFKSRHRKSESPTGAIGAYISSPSHLFTLFRLPLPPKPRHISDRRDLGARAPTPSSSGTALPTSIGTPSALPSSNTASLHTSENSGTALGVRPDVLHYFRRVPYPGQPLQCQYVRLTRSARNDRKCKSGQCSGVSGVRVQIESDAERWWPLRGLLGGHLVVCGVQPAPPA